MTLRLATLALLVAASSPVFAERADRDKPLVLEAYRVSIDDAKKIQVLEGDVVVTKGTMMLRAEHIVISEDKYGFQKGVAHAGKGGLARFRQKREGKDEYVEGEAERIEYNTNNEVAELFQRAWVKIGEDQVRGDYIWYDAINEKYLVTAGEGRDSKGAPARVRAVLQPRNKEAPAATTSASSPPPSLKPAATLGNPPR